MERESTLKAKLLENQKQATRQVEQMQKALNKQKADIDLVMELNESLKMSKERLSEKLAQLKEELQKEKTKRKEFLESLNENDVEKVRTSQRLVTQDKEMDRMNMLYRQIASEKAALNREKELLAEKLEKKKQKHAYTKQQLEETTKQFERVRDENQAFGGLISQVMAQLKGKEANTPQIGNEIRQSLALISQNQPFGGMNSSGYLGLNTSQNLLNRNSHIKKVIRGGNGS